jgi:hypothetical protein
MISILNSIFTVVFYTMRWTKLDLTCIYFEEFLNQLNLLYICIYLYLQHDKSYESHELMSCILEYDHSLAEMICLILFIVPWFYFLYIYKYFLILVSCNNQGNTIMLSFKVWLSLAWIEINMWIHVNIKYLKSHIVRGYQLVIATTKTRWSEIDPILFFRPLIQWNSLVEIYIYI